MSQLETLPNELLCDIFRFLNTVDLLDAFFDLNSRFDQSIYTHFRSQLFNLQSIDKYHFDRICQKHLFKLRNNIFALHLTNHDETPNLCELFLSSGTTLAQFTQLQSLTLSHIDSFRTINKLIVQCRHLLSLQKLSLIDCQGIGQQDKHTANLINNIWSLPNLVHCTINNIKIRKKWIRRVTMICSTLQYLSVKMIEGEQDTFYYLSRSIPHLQQLNVEVIQWSFYNESKILFSSVISLKTTFHGSIDRTILFLKSLPNLFSLTLEINVAVLNGYDWQTLLVNHLPKLKIFRLKTNFSYSTNGNSRTYINQLVDSFRTPFWIEEQQWFIRCDCCHGNRVSRGVLYTLPCSFKQPLHLNAYYSASTKPNDECYSHRNVHDVNQGTVQLDSVQNLKLANLRYPNIRRMALSFPLIDDLNFVDHFSFNRLISLSVTLNNRFSYDQLQTFLHRTPQLYALRFNSFEGSITGLFQLTCPSVRRLDFTMAQWRRRLVFNQENCLNLIRSSLGRQCEVLLIELENRHDIVELVGKLCHLRVLICSSNDYYSNYRVFTFQKIERLIPWLKKNLSPKCSITDNSDRQSMTSIWIYRETNQLPLPNDQILISNERLDVIEHSINRRDLCIFFFVLFLSYSSLIFDIQDIFRTSFYMS